jgi:hypothetical protein
MSWAQKTILKIRDNYSALVAIAHYLHRIYFLQSEISNIQGTTYGGKISLVVGAPTTRINFTKVRGDVHMEDINKPVNMKFVIPHRPLVKLQLASEGPADCEYKVLGGRKDTDVDPLDLSTSLILRGGTPSFDTKEVSVPLPRIRALNIRAIETVIPGGGAAEEVTVRIEITI